MTSRASSNFTIPLNTLAAAYDDGVRPLSRRYHPVPAEASPHAPCAAAYNRRSSIVILQMISSRASRSFTTASCPLSAAYNSGVCPCLSFKFTSISSHASSSFTTASCPSIAAYDSGVRAYISINSHQRCPVPATASPLPRALFRLQTNIGVPPSRSPKFTSILFCANSSFTTASRPLRAA